MSILKQHILAYNFLMLDINKIIVNELKKRGEIKSSEGSIQVRTTLYRFGSPFTHSAIDSVSLIEDVESEIIMIYSNNVQASARDENLIDVLNFIDNN